MADEPTPRQVLYAIVAGAFHVVVGVLAVASVGLAPMWWTVGVFLGWAIVAAVIIRQWRRTGLVLGLSILGFAIWTVGAALLLT